MPKELKRVDPKVRDYARKCLWGIDVDPDLRKAARMNMVMNNDGHGNIFEANTLELVAAEHPDATARAREFMTDEMQTFVKRSGGLGAFDYVFTNPPFGAKIPVEDPDILRAFDLGHTWKKNGDTWTKGEPQKKVPPEILFIEACFQFLKPGTGVMAIVLPNGILGQSGRADGVRALVDAATHGAAGQRRPAGRGVSSAGLGPGKLRVSPSTR